MIAAPIGMTEAALPIVSFSSLAKAMNGMSPLGLAALLAGHKHRSMGPRRSYQDARRQAMDFFVDGVPLDPDAPLRSHEREAVRALQASKPRLPRWIRAHRPILPRVMIVHGVRVSMHADVELLGRRERG